MFRKLSASIKRGLHDLGLFSKNKSDEGIRNDYPMNRKNEDDLIAVDSKFQKSKLLTSVKAIAVLGTPLLAVGVVLGVISFFVPPLAVPALAFAVCGASLTATALIMHDGYHDRLMHQVYGPTQKNVYRESVNDKTRRDSILGLEPRTTKERLLSGRSFGKDSVDFEDSRKVISLDTDFIVSRKQNRDNDRQFER